MTRRWRDYRAITVRKQRFRWKCDFHVRAEKLSRAYADAGHRWEPDRLIVRVEESPRVMLTVTWPACEAPVIQPHMVRAMIESAMDRGWPDRERAVVLPASVLA